MAIQPFIGCKFPDLLEKSLFDLDQELGDRIIANTKLLSDAADLIQTGNLDAVLDEASKTLDSLFDAVQTPQTVAYLKDPANNASPLGSGASNGDQIGDGSGKANNSNVVKTNEIGLSPSDTGVQKADDILDVYGLPKSDATKKDLETLLINVGIVAVDGILMPSGDIPAISATYLNNIQNLREAYFAANKSLAEVDAVLKAGKFVYYTQTVGHLKLPTVGKPPTLAQIKELTSLKYLSESDYYQTNDPYNPYAMILTTAYHGKEDIFASNLSAKCFHVDSITVANNTHVKLEQHGFSQLDIEAVFSGQDFRNVNDSHIVTLNKSKDVCLTVVKQINFALSRIKTYNNSSKQSFLLNLWSSIGQSITLHSQAISKHVSTVTMLDSGLLAKLRVRYTEAQIVDILENRPEIKGIWIDATDEELANVLLSASHSITGTTSLSNKYVSAAEQQPTSLKVLMAMATYLEKALEYSNKAVNSGSVYASNFENVLASVKAYLVDYIGFDPYSDTIVNKKPVTYGGITSYVSPASILTEVADPVATFRVEEKVAEIQAMSESELSNIYGAKFAKSVSKIINAIAGFFEKAMKAVQKLIDLAKKQVLAIKKKIDALFAKITAVLGGGVYEDSMFKCALNFDVSLGLPILDSILALMDSIESILSNFIGSIAKWVGDILDKIICLPASLLNMFSAALTLPVPCAIKGFPAEINLGVKLETALARLKISVDVQQMVLSNFGTDLVKCKLMSALVPNQLVSFKASSLCNNDKVDKFYKASMLNIGF